MGYLCTTVAQTFVKTEVKQSMRRVADWQIAHYNKAIYGDLNWVNATFYLGLVHWAAIAEQTDKDDSYYKWLLRLGNRNYWQVNQRMYHADDICVSQMYLYMYEKVQKKKVCLSRHRHVPNGDCQSSLPVRSSWTMAMQPPWNTGLGVTHCSWHLLFT